MPYNFCEEQLCAWISQPANTWTNIGYLIVGYIILQSAKLNQLKYIFGWASIILAFCSGIFHANNTVWAKLLDVGAMILLSSAVMTISVGDYFHLTKLKKIIIFATVFLISISLLIITRHGGTWFGFEILVAIIFEYLASRNKTHVNLLPLKKGLIVLVIAIIFMVMDRTGILCDPSNHLISGHGIWHLLAAVCIYYSSIYFCSSARELD